MNIKYGTKLKATLVAFPEKWNTFHYIVETESEFIQYKTVYFSEQAERKPTDCKVGQEGYVIYRYPGIFHWENAEAKILPNPDNNKKED